ncbi:unnamed protein product [Schistosoma curassoni]|uniref:Uncharacterized protein n=1 Tax=Schistosoma curassoni TaxID=6186 RepID=A0A183KQL6_9TREM|nr:unnamed protein product [Schistosoma curassoni]
MESCIKISLSSSSSFIVLSSVIVNGSSGWISKSFKYVQIVELVEEPGFI